MDMVYSLHPVFVLFPIILLAWQIFTFLLKKRKTLSQTVEILLAGIGVVGHSIAITVILLFDGTLSDVLVLVLLSGALSLLLSPTPNKKEEE